jgi:hypothetical protein
MEGDADWEKAAMTAQVGQALARSKTRLCQPISLSQPHCTLCCSSIDPPSQDIFSYGSKRQRHEIRRLARPERSSAPYNLRLPSAHRSTHMTPDFTVHKYRTRDSAIKHSDKSASQVSGRRLALSRYASRNLINVIRVYDEAYNISRCVERRREALVTWTMVNS